MMDLYGFQRLIRNLDTSKPGATRTIFWKYAKNCFNKDCLVPSLEDRKSQFCNAAAKICCGSGNYLICHTYTKSYNTMQNHKLPYLTIFDHTWPYLTLHDCAWPYIRINECEIHINWAAYADKKCKIATEFIFTFNLASAFLGEWQQNEWIYWCRN